MAAVPVGGEKIEPHASQNKTKKKTKKKEFSSISRFCCKWIRDGTASAFVLDISATLEALGLQ